MFIFNGYLPGYGKDFVQVVFNVYAMVFIRPIARVGSGDPVRVLRLYTMITLDEVCSIYC